MMDPNHAERDGEPNDVAMDRAKLPEPTTAISCATAVKQTAY